MIKSLKYGLLPALMCILPFSCKTASDPVHAEKAHTYMNNENSQVAVLGAGCFWCVEAIFEALKGVQEVVSGYAGGEIKNPSYKEVCTGRTGHAEVVKIIFHPDTITFDELLEVFWQTHDPTTLNRQGADVGTQYRSVVFYTSEEQKRIAETYKKRLNEEGAYPNPVVTEISAFDVFYPAEDYHQEYFRNNKDQPYCAMVIKPKMEKFRKVFAEKIRN
ncbi:MAG: peptide-methionine (S)-S-oxide reductase [Cryomorphaceae bacterium]|nr:MAG: peptide-methionine (S)-S-oxide reductase [Cryomorphaceae bacterium]